MQGFGGHNFDGGYDRGPGERHFAYSSRRRQPHGPSTRQIVWPIVALVVLVVGWFIVRPGPGPETAPDPAPTSTSPPASDPGTSGAARPEFPALALPAVEASDDFVRELVSRLSSRPQWIAWFVSDELVHRFVVAVVNLSGGMSPASELEDLAPDGEFGTTRSGAREVIDPATYRRYAAFAETFASLDTPGTAVQYLQLHPLFEEAYGALGIRDMSFDDAVARAAGNLLAVEVRDTPYEVELDEGVWVFADPAIEARSAAEKHLLRMGPENARLFQSKLEELIETIGIEVVTGR